MEIRAEQLEVGSRFVDASGRPLETVEVVCPRGGCTHAPERDRWTTHVRRVGGDRGEWFVAHHDNEILRVA